MGHNITGTANRSRHKNSPLIGRIVDYVMDGERFESDSIFRQYSAIELLLREGSYYYLLCID